MRQFMQRVATTGAYAALTRPRGCRCPAGLQAGAKRGAGRKKKAPGETNVSRGRGFTGEFVTKLARLLHLSWERWASLSHEEAPVRLGVVTGASQSPVRAREGVPSLSNAGLRATAVFMTVPPDITGIAGDQWAATPGNGTAFSALAPS